MASSNDNVSMALFCDFENVALGVRDANYDKFDIKPVLERLLLKGSIVVKKAYCDWDRYKGFKAPMHEANFELIEIPHVRQSGKNSADIRMVVDALDLCYTKSHVDTFVIISGDSDFSPLVSKLRENAKKVIGVGVKQSTSDLLVANCDEFIFYDDLVRESRRAKRDTSEARPAVKRSPEEERARREEMDKRRNQAVEIAVDTFEALVLERGDSGKIWASVLKEAIKRRKPDFSESYYGFRTFGNLIEECKARGLLEFGRDEKSGAYVYRGSGVPTPAGTSNGMSVDVGGQQETHGAADGEGTQAESRRSRNRGRSAAERFAQRQADRLAQQARGAQTGDGHAALAAEGADLAQPAQQEQQLQNADVAERSTAAASPVEAVVSADADGAPAKRKNGPKPPARKVKAAQKQKTGQGAEPQAEASAAAPVPAALAKPGESQRDAQSTADSQPREASAEATAQRQDGQPRGAQQARQKGAQQGQQKGRQQGQQKAQQKVQQKGSAQGTVPAPAQAQPPAPPVVQPQAEPQGQQPAGQAAGKPAQAKRSSGAAGKGGRNAASGKRANPAASPASTAAATESSAPAQPLNVAAEPLADAKPARKPAARKPRPPKAASSAE